ncbi:MAG: hypothetical protein ACREKL_06505 [Chthoniobacterales bacterium]
MARSFLVLALTVLAASPAAFAQPTPTPLPPLDGDRPNPPAEGAPRPNGDRPKFQDQGAPRDNGDRPKPRDNGGPKPDGDRPRKDRGQKPGDPDRRPPGDDGMFQKFRERLEQMSPEERQKFKDNWMRWKQMGDGERNDWQKRAMEERERIKKNIDEAVAKLGLKLDEDQREVFALRYRQERHKLEQALSQEIDQKRKAGIEKIMQGLKAEFSNQPKASPSPAGTPAPAAAPQ